MNVPLAETPFALPPPEAIRQTAREIVARPEYRLGGSAWDPTVLFERVGNILEKIFSPLRSVFRALHATSPVLAWLLLIGLLAMLGLLLAHMVYMFVRAIRQRRVAMPDLESRERAARVPELWEQKAQEALAGQDYLWAVRCLFRAGLLRLEAGRRRKFRPGGTNREFLRLFSDTPAFGPMRSFVEVIDVKWYGGGSCAADDYQQCAAAYGAIRRFAEESTHADGA